MAVFFGFVWARLGYAIGLPTGHVKLGHLPVTAAQPEERPLPRAGVPQGTLPDVAPRHLLAARVADPVRPDLALVHALAQPLLVGDVPRLREPGRVVGCPHVSLSLLPWYQSSVSVGIKSFMISNPDIYYFGPGG